MRRALIALSLLVVGCPGRGAPSRPFHEASAVLSAYRDMRRPARVIRARASVDRRGSEGRIRGTVNMFVARPDRVRFDAMTQFGPAAILTSDGARFALMDLRERRFMVGPPCPENIERLLGLRFDGAEVARLLFGESPWIDAERVEMTPRNGGYFLVRHGADGRRQELDYEVRVSDHDAAPEDQRMRLRQSALYGPDGQLLWRVSYREWRFVEDPGDTHTPRRGVAMPFIVQFIDPRHGVDTEVRFSAIDLNVNPPRGVFTQRARPGLEVSHVGCGG